MSDEEFVLGIDGGGTGSRAIAISFDGQPLVRVEGGPLNFYTTSEDIFRKSLGDLRRQISTSLSGKVCVHTVVGTAALLDRPSEDQRKIATDGIAAASPDELTLLGDAVAAGFGATGGAPGVLLIAGTGSIGIGFNQDGDYMFRGGFGPFLGGDPGSAYWIASRAVIEAQDDPELEGLVCSHFGVEKLTDLIPLLYRDGFDTPKLAGLCEALSVNPTEEWMSIEEQAGRKLTKMARPLCRFVNEPYIPVYASGSVLQHNPRVRKSVEQNLGWSLESPKLDAACGAALLALQKAGSLVSPSLIARLREHAQ